MIVRVMFSAFNSSAAVADFRFRPQILHLSPELSTTSVSRQISRFDQKAIYKA